VADLSGYRLEGELLYAVSGGVFGGETASITLDCFGCGACVAYCPLGAITMGISVAEIYKDTCIGCSSCLGLCPTGAIVCN